jgi:hypothetical protein
MFFVFILLTFQSEGVAQPLEKELYSLDIYHVRTYGMSDSVRASYWVNRLTYLARRPPDNVAARLLLEEVELLKEEVSASNGKPDAYQEAIKKYDAALISMIPRIFDSIDTDLLAFEVIEKIKHTLDVKSSQIAKSSTSAKTWLSVPLLEDYLGLSDIQKTKIKAEVDSAKVELEQINELELLRRLSQKRWDEILKVCDGDQVSEVKRLVGIPFEWFAMSRENELFDLSLLRSGPSVNGTNAFPLLKAGVDVKAMKQEELEKAGVIVLPAVTYELFFNRFFWDSISLTAEQKEEILGPARNELVKKVFVEGGDAFYFHQLIAGDAKLPRLLLDLFDEEQQKRALQIEFQILAGRKFQSSAGLLHPTVAELLNFRKDQLRDIERIGFDFEMESRELIETLNEKRKAIGKRLGESTLGVLNERQLSLYTELVGR